MTGTIITITRTGPYVTGSVRVYEGPQRGNVEYAVTVRAVDANNVPLAVSEIKAALAAAVQAQRAQGPPQTVDLSAVINGTVNL